MRLGVILPSTTPDGSAFTGETRTRPPGSAMCCKDHQAPCLPWDRLYSGAFMSSGTGPS